jgi:sec-independent protein translocase protein TatA
VELTSHLVLGFGMPHGMDWIWVTLVALLIFGAKLPQVMRNLGGSVREFKKGMEDIGGNPPSTSIAATIPPSPARVEGAVPRDARALPASIISDAKIEPTVNTPS